MKVLSFTVAVTAGLLAMGMASPAIAVEKQTLAAGACKSALPVFDGNIRSRPLAVQNEGSSSAFVTCAQQGDNSQVPTMVAIILINRNAVATTVNCTMVNHPFQPVYKTQSIEVPAGANNEILRFPAPDGSFSSYTQAFSCNLPPGTGINRLAIVHN